METHLSVGIDIAKEKFDACIKEQPSPGHYLIKARRMFSNSPKGFEQFACWVQKAGKDKQSLFVMEATGVYYENLAWFLHEKGYRVFVELPNKVKHYFKSINLKTKTDRVDAAALARMGFERKIRQWIPPCPEIRQLRDLTRLLLSCQKDLNRFTSQLEAMEHAHGCSPVVVQMQRQQVEHTRKLIAQLKKQRRQMVKNNEPLKELIQRICTIKAIAFDTAVSILAETNAFLLFTSINQLISYAGLDVCHNQSGRHRGRSSISKKGNARIRAVLYMPALNAIRYNKPIKELYERIREKNPTASKKGVVAAMRKLLLFIYTICKKQTCFEQNHKWGDKAQKTRRATKRPAPSFLVKKSGSLTSHT